MVLQRKNRKQRNLLGDKYEFSPVKIDRPQPLSDHPLAFDATFFCGANSDGLFIILNMERRKEDICYGKMYILHPKKGLMVTPRVPDTKLRSDSRDSFSAEGMKFEPVSPHKEWKLAYDGKLRSTENGELFDVTFDGRWHSTWPIFNYDTDMSAVASARAFAKEPWSRTFFEHLKEAHQTHYEQVGRMSGTLRINGTEETVECPSFRDHSYGKKRDWSLMHRYGFHTMFMEDGTAATVGVVSQPVTCSHLELGYIYHSTGKVEAVDWVDLKLYQHGEGGRSPRDHAFRFGAGGKTYHVDVTVLPPTPHLHFYGAEAKSKMVQRFCKFVLTSYGFNNEARTLKGQGFSDWIYNLDSWHWEGTENVG
ncbi:unnamed protein product [Cyprideis torosa]|uniref:Uncharacterized protein n=1 Tax=Cyprideis torosa TaxID=163714 RepID=A0A7R8WM13_9CRUS|nr:unnamed protein product [Cyprideis torosa]CAG0897914.1 unnamed protein product [Cyprideis torosa]